jgi:hypothetical protein
VISLLRHLLGTLWLAVAALCLWGAVGQIRLIMAPEGSDEWRHSEWALPAAALCVVVAVPYLLSGLGLIARWRWQRLWVYGPFLLLLPIATLLLRT